MGIAVAPVGYSAGAAVSDEAVRVLVLGGPSAGKSTFLMQLYGRAANGACELKLRSAPESLAAISDGWKRLQQGLPPGHTPHGTETSLTLATLDQHDREINITVPEYAGEDLQRVGETRRISTRWQELAADNDHWIVMIRLAQHPDIPDLITRPVGELAGGGSSITSDQDSAALPIDMLTVELLQVFRHSRSLSAIRVQRESRLTLVLSCWDELDLPETTKPDTVAHDRLALLDSYCRSRWGTRYRVLGLSSQGQALVEDNPSEQFIDHGPHSMGWLVDANGVHHQDLTKLIVPE